MPPSMTIEEPARRASATRRKNPSRDRVSRCLLVTTLLASTLFAACSVESLVVKKLGKTLNGTSSIFATDEDPELVREALPFALKTIEALLDKQPENPDLLLAACSGFTQYAYAFVETDALALEFEDYRASQRQALRARKLYERALRYCQRGLESTQPGIVAQLSLQPEATAASLSREHLDLLYWTGAVWGIVVANGVDQPERIAEVPVPRAILERVLELDDAYGNGAIHEAFIVLDALPVALGGSEASARQHFERAVALSNGTSAGAYVTLAKGISVANQDREEFERLLQAALAVDPDQDPSRRLANLIAQQRARILLETTDEYFL